MKVSVVCATYNRADMLDRALYTYSKQTMPTEDWEYLIVDDASQDDTVGVIEKWQGKGLPLRLFRAAEDLGLPKEPGQWRDGCKLRNAASTHAFGEVLIMTHPEIMIPRKALAVMYDAAMESDPKSWITAMPYWLPPMDWKKNTWKRNLSALRDVDGFWDDSWPEPLPDDAFPDYRNQNQESRDDWESEVFWAMRMSTWRWLGGFREFDVWGSVDMDFHQRRTVAEIKTVIARDDSKSNKAPSGNLMVYHQHHGESPRDIDKAMKAAAGADYSTVDKMREHGGLHAIQHHGPREVPVDKSIGGVLNDHINRYIWANFFCNGKNVLDIPCGTGYGSKFVDSAKSYVGVDLDAVSVNFALSAFVRDGVTFDVGNMEGGIPLKSNSVDQVLCFEGIEHIENKQAFVREMKRVLTEPGWFIISTPQKGVAGGTPWDRFMLTMDELRDLLVEAGAYNLAWFKQVRYGDSIVESGEPGPDDHIMIVGGTF